MEQSRGIKYPYDLPEAVENIALKLGDICRTPGYGAVILSRSPILKHKGDDYGMGLPGSIEVIENNLSYIPNPNIGQTALRTSSYLFIRALKAAGGSGVVIYMPAAALKDGLPSIAEAGFRLVQNSF